MPNDDSPSDFIYVSKRLTQEIVQKHEATRPPHQWSFQLAVKLLTLSVAKRQLDYTNRFEMAQRAAEAIKDTTGSLAYPGDYVRAEIDLWNRTIPVHMGWDGTANAKIAVFVADATLSDSGKTFVALIGSVGNYLGHEDQQSTVGGWFPSDIMGLYGVLQGGLESSDPKFASDFLADDSDMSEIERCDAALTMFGHREKLGSPRRLSVLARVHHHVTNYDRPGEHYDTILLGAPVWIGTPARKPFRFEEN